MAAALWACTASSPTGPLAQAVESERPAAEAAETVESERPRKRPRRIGDTAAEGEWLTGSTVAEAAPCIDLRGFIVDSDAAELARSYVIGQLLDAARRGAGQHLGDAAGALSTRTERLGEDGALVDMTFDGYAEGAVVLDGTMTMRVADDSVGADGPSGDGHLRLTGRLQGRLWPCPRLAEVLIAAALGIEPQPPEPEAPATLDDGRQERGADSL